MKEQITTIKPEVPEDLACIVGSIALGIMGALIVISLFLLLR